MPDKKNQHFVPKLLLRHFASDLTKRQIGIFSPDKMFYREKVSLGSQAQEDYFYGKENGIEELLGDFEAAIAPIISKIIEDNKLPSKNSKDYLLLFQFAVIQSSRTKPSAKVYEDFTDKLMKEVAKNDVDIGKFYERGGRIKLSSPVLMSMMSAAQTYRDGLDLEVKLIKNHSTTPFITSDNPVVKYNQFLEFRKHPGGHLGIVSMGLQIFFPISPRLTILFYDGWVYKVGNRNEAIVNIDKSSDVDNINMLQVANCDTSVFFNSTNTEMKLKALSNKVRKLRETEYTDLHILDRFKDSEQQEHIQLFQHGNNENFNLRLSFIKQTKNAKLHNMSDLIVQIRQKKIKQGWKPTYPPENINTDHE